MTQDNTKICENCKSNSNRIRKGLCNNCYTKNRIHGDPNFLLAAYPKELTEHQNNIIIGSLLGDGHLRRKKENHNTSLYIKRTFSDYEYLLWEYNQLQNIITDAGISIKQTFDKRTNKFYKNCSFITRSLIILNSFYDTWYKNKTKIVPRNLVLTPEIIAVWFCDDGFISITNKHTINIGLATNGFNKGEVEFLASLLEKRYGVPFNINKSKKKKNGKLQYVINASTYAAIKIIRDIENCLPEGMERKRKWTEELLLECESANNLFSHKLSSQEKIKKLIIYFNSVNEFHIADMGKNLNWTFTRSDGTIEVPTSNISKYLDKYIKRKFIIKIERDNFKGKYKYIITESGKKYFAKELLKLE